MDAVAGIAERVSQVQRRITQVSMPTTGFDTVLGEVVLARSMRADTWSTAVDATTALSAAGSGADRVDSRGAPAELAGYGNGRIPSGALSAIDGTGHRLWAPAARSFEALRDAAAADHVTIGITDSYRSYESQVELAGRKGLYSQGGLAATPGTSMHGWGVALDLGLDPAAQAWMRTNAGRFGFVENVPREPWHWQYQPTH